MERANELEEKTGHFQVCARFAQVKPVSEIGLFANALNSQFDNTRVKLDPFYFKYKLKFLTDEILAAIST